MAKYRAIFAYDAAQPGDLSFQVGDIIYVLDTPNSGWWHGRTEDGRQGVFPFNRVEEADPNEPEYNLEDILSGKKAEVERKEDSVKSVTITVVSPVPEINVRFDVTVKTSNDQELTASKQMKDFRVLCEVFSSFSGRTEAIMGLDRTERINSTLPEWADNVRLDPMFAAPKMKDRASILTDWLGQKIGRDAKQDFAIVHWLDSRAEFYVKEGTKKDVTTELDQAASAYDRRPRSKDPVVAKTLFKWRKKDETDISLEKHEMLVVEGESDFQGWLIGEKVNGDKGLFPHNYIKELDPPEANYFLHADAPAPRKVELPPIPPTAAKASSTQKQQREKVENGVFSTGFGVGGADDNNVYEAVNPNVQKDLSNVFMGGAKGQGQKPRQRQKIEKYKLCSTEAFDELLEKGVTMEQNGDLIRKGPSANSPREGDKVILFYSGYIWEPQKQELLEFDSSDKLVSSNNPNKKYGPLEFIIGANQAIDGIEEAVKRMVLGQSARVTLTPAMAYQDVGFPPDIPGNAYLVYDLKLNEIKKGDGTQNAAFAGLLAQGAQRSTVQKREPSYRGMNGGPSMRNMNRAATGVGGGKPKRNMTLVQLQKIVRDKSYDQFGIDASITEEYLSDIEFINAFGVQRSQWQLMPAYRRTELKRKAGLF